MTRVWVCIRPRVRFKIRARVWVRNGVRLRFGDAVKFGIVAQLVSKFTVGSHEVHTSSNIGTDRPFF